VVSLASLTQGHAGQAMYRAGMGACQWILSNTRRVSSPCLLKYIGSRAVLPDSPTENPTWVREFCQRNSNATLGRFYLHHPATALRFLRDDLYNEAWRIRMDNLSNYRREAGHPAGARTPRMGWWSAASSGAACFFAMAIGCLANWRRSTSCPSWG
jgi:hypothetical protein